MELIVLTRRRRIQRALHLGGPLVTVLGLVVLSALAGAFWLGYQQAPTVSIVEVAPKQPVPPSTRAELVQTRRQVSRALDSARIDLDALTLRLSDLQARSIRLDALGARLVDLAGLDEAEFSFGAPPARGGPAPAAGSEPNRVQDFIVALEELEEVLERRSQELVALESQLVTDRVARSLRPAGRPLEQGWMSSGYGPRADPLTGQRSMHYGVDFAGRAGSPVRAVAGGIVRFSGTRSSLGRVVEIDHGNGYVTRYAHNRKNLVKSGQRIAKGEQVAELGSSGRSTGTHVHFEVLHNGQHVNPMKFIRAGGNPSES